MDPLTRLHEDCRGLMRRQRHQGAVERWLLHEAAGGPRRQPRKLRPGPMRHLVGREGPTVSIPVGGVNWIPDELMPFQQGAPPLPERKKAVCCHCVRAGAARQARQQALARAGGQGGPIRGPGQFGALADRIGRATPKFLIDAHSHFFGYTAADFMAALIFFALSPDSEVRRRTSWLVDDMGAAGIGRMVLSGFIDSTVDPSTLAPDDWVLGTLNTLGIADPGEIDYSVKYAAAMYPDYFLPLYNGFSLEALVGGADFQTDFLDGLDAYPWKGIGEIVVQGHGLEADEDRRDMVIEILKAAADRGLPVALHWDMGAVDVGDAQASFEYFSEVLDAVPEAVVVLCHVGLGPTDYLTGSAEPDWEGRFMNGSGSYASLWSRQNLYFDIGGMQVGAQPPAFVPVEDLYTSSGMTAAGQFILARIEDDSSRFMFGTDVETRAYSGFIGSTDNKPHNGVTDYANSVGNYDRFLAFNSSLSDDDRAAVRYRNAWNIYG